MTQFGLYADAHGVRNLNNFADFLYVFLIGQNRTVYHDRGKAGAQRRHNFFIAAAMIQVDRNRHGGSIRQAGQEAAVEYDVRVGRAAHIQDDGSIQLFRRFQSAARIQLGVDVRGRNAVIFSACAFKDFFHGH